MIMILSFIIMLCCTMNISSVNAEAKEEALNTVVNFLNAQKDCDVEGMMTYSERAEPISNVREFYKMMCRDYPLQNAKITDIKIMNKSIALASIESTYKERIFIGTSPVVKIDGKWKLIRGIPGAGYVEFSTKSNRDKVEVEVEKAINSYSSALKSGDMTEIKKYIMIPPDANQDRLEEHFKAISEEPKSNIKVTAKGIKVISDTFAIAQIEVKRDHFSFTENHAVGKENGQWKVLFGPTLTNSAIPIGDKPVEVE